LFEGLDSAPLRGARLLNASVVFPVRYSHLSYRPPRPSCCPRRTASGGKGWIALKIEESLLGTLSADNWPPRRLSRILSLLRKTFACLAYGPKIDSP
jgi:hypothetical protein